ncbi:MAG: hypothetical protein M1823_006353, partial [Watsoniomyces obsoletus]
MSMPATPTRLRWTRAGMIAVGSLLCGVLAACAGDPDPAPAQAPAPVSGEPVPPPPPGPAPVPVPAPDPVWTTYIPPQTGLTEPPVPTRSSSSLSVNQFTTGSGRTDISGRHTLSAIDASQHAISVFLHADVDYLQANA